MGSPKYMKLCELYQPLDGKRSAVPGKLALRFTREVVSTSGRDVAVVMVHQTPLSCILKTVSASGPISHLLKFVAALTACGLCPSFSRSAKAASHVTTENMASFVVLSDDACISSKHVLTLTVGRGNISPAGGRHQAFGHLLISQ